MDKEKVVTIGTIGHVGSISAGSLTGGIGILTGEVAAVLSDFVERDLRRTEMEVIGNAADAFNIMYGCVPADFSLAEKRTTSYLFGPSPALAMKTEGSRHMMPHIFSAPYGQAAYSMPNPWLGLSAKEQWGLVLKGGNRAPRGCRELKHHRAIISGQYRWVAEAGTWVWRRVR